jgi:hypothetical protein
MKRFILIIIFFVIFTNTTEAQTDNIKLNCIENNQVCDYLLEDSDTIWKNCVDPYFPINDYLNYGEDCFELYWLYKYSFLLQAIDEKVLYKENKNFTRILLLKAKMSKLILIERKDSHYNITIKEFELDTIILPKKITKIDYQINSYSLPESDYKSIDDVLKKSDIYSVEAHPVQYFAFSDYDVVCFESYGYGGYLMTDLYIPFIKNVKQYKGLLKFIEKIEDKVKKHPHSTKK